MLLGKFKFQLIKWLIFIGLFDALKFCGKLSSKSRDIRRIVFKCFHIMIDFEYGYVDAMDGKYMENVFCFNQRGHCYPPTGNV